MITKTIYVAFDGKEFDYEDDCEKYESATELKELGDDLLLYDKDGNRIEVLNDELIDKIEYIITKSERAYNCLVEKMDYYGYQYPFNSQLPICSYYNYDKQKWCDIKDKIEDLQEELDELSKYLIK